MTNENLNRSFENPLNRAREAYGCLVTWWGQKDASQQAIYLIVISPLLIFIAYQISHSIDSGCILVTVIHAIFWSKLVSKHTYEFIAFFLGMVTGDLQNIKSPADVISKLSKSITEVANAILNLLSTSQIVLNRELIELIYLCTTIFVIILTLVCIVTLCGHFYTVPQASDSQRLRSNTNG